MRLQDKVAIITGAGQGIGEAYARRFATFVDTVIGVARVIVPLQPKETTPPWLIAARKLASSQTDTTAAFAQRQKDNPEPRRSNKKRLMNSTAGQSITLGGTGSRLQSLRRC